MIMGPRGLGGAGDSSTVASTAGVMGERRGKMCCGTRAWCEHRARGQGERAARVVAGQLVRTAFFLWQSTQTGPAPSYLERLVGCERPRRQKGTVGEVGEWD